MATLEFSRVDFLLRDANFKSVHHCKLCPYVSKSIFFMRNHARRHRLFSTPFNCFEGSPEIYHCVDCDLRTDTVKLLSKHIQQSHLLNAEIEEFSVSSYICRYCDFETYSRLHWLKHSKTDCVDEEDSIENEEDQTLCRSDIQEGQKNVEQQHMEIDNNTQTEKKKLFQCGHCDYETNYRTHIKIHVLAKHTEDMIWFKCEHCSFKTKWKYGLKGHQLNKHPNIEDIKWYKCEQCDFKSKYKGSLKTHITYKHPNNEAITWHKCEHCDHKVTDKKNLKTHVLRKHTDTLAINWILCHHCGHKSKSKYDLENHILYKHTPPEDVVWHKCEYCDHKVKVKSQLKPHMRRKHKAFSSHDTELI